MAIRVVRLGEPRAENEGIRLGTVRRPPRGVRKEHFGALDYYDVWLPELSPDQETLSWALSEPWTDKRWATFAKRYRSQMSAAAPRHLIELLAAMSKQTNVSVGCYCEDATRCHRSVLHDLLVEAGADVIPTSTGVASDDAPLRSE